jgi:hypothetical protein
MGGAIWTCSVGREVCAVDADGIQRATVRREKKSNDTFGQDNMDHPQALAADILPQFRAGGEDFDEETT